MARSRMRRDCQNATISGCLIQQNTRGYVGHTKLNRTRPTDMMNSCITQLTDSKTHRPFTRTRRTIRNTIAKEWLGQAAARETMYNRLSQIEITTQMRIMKPIHTAANARSRKPQINNNTAINEAFNPILSSNNSRIVIKRPPFNRLMQPINSSNNKSDPSTKQIHFIHTGGIC